MSFVLDASVTACWCFPDEPSAAADAAMGRLIDEEALVPPVWTLEIRSIPVVNERRGRVGPGDTNAFLRDISLLPIRVRDGADAESLPEPARRHDLTTCDTAYLCLAVQASAPVATLDRSLARAVQAEGLQVIAA